MNANGRGESGDGEFDARKLKRTKFGPGQARQLKKVAEIVLVLSTMTRIRGGKTPTEGEMELMAEARAKLAEACVALAPKNAVGREAIGTVIEDLGLGGKVKDQRLGIRSPNLTIKEKFENAKRKMDESKKFSVHSAAYTSHPKQPISSTLAESRGALHTLRTFPSDKQGHPSVSCRGIPASSPSAHASATVTCTSLQYQMTTAAMNSRGLPSSHLEKDPYSLSLPKVERVRFKLDGSNRSSYAPQFQVNSSADHPMVTAPTWSIQTQSTSMAKSGQEYRLSNLTSAKAEGTIDASTSRVPTQTARDQSSRPFITQTAPVDLPSIHQAVQGMSFVQAPSPGNSHNEIAKLIQKLLQPQHPEHPKWTPPSRDYMNKALTCQMCQLTINEVDNVLLCDACEKGYHLKCLQPNQNGIPRSEWHCMGCLALTQGKPLPPKYGRVMRSSMNQPNLSSDIAMKVSSLEKKVGTLHPKVNQLKMTANGSSGLRSPAHAGTADTNHVDSASDIKIPDAKENQGSNSASSIKNADEKPFAGVHTNIPLKPLSVGSSSVNSIQNAKDYELSTCEERSFEEEIDPPAKVSEKVGNNPYHSLPSHNSHVDWRDLSNCAEVPLTNAQRPYCQRTTQVSCQRKY